MKQNVTAKSIAIFGISILAAFNVKAQSSIINNLTVGTVVPAKKLSAQAVDNNVIHISWASSINAVNVDAELERSYDQASFKTICLIMAPESPEMAPMVCNFKDRNAAVNAAGSEIYYRLKQTDKAGHVTYSEVVTVKLAAQINP